MDWSGLHTFTCGVVTGIAVESHAGEPNMGAGLLPGLARHRVWLGISVEVGRPCVFSSSGDWAKTQAH